MNKNDFSKCDYIETTGISCLYIISKHYGKPFSPEQIKEENGHPKPSSLLSLSNVADNIGLKSIITPLPFSEWNKTNLTPFVIQWEKKHFVVISELNKKFVKVIDPLNGHIKYKTKEFNEEWKNKNGKEEILSIQPSSSFYNSDDEKINKLDSEYLINYLKPYKKFIFQLFLGMLLGSLLQLILPFLTQSIVDIGIQNQDIGFINIILLAQLMLFLSMTSAEFIRSWIVLHLGTRINVAITSDFLIKIMKLPIHFFEGKKIGGILQSIAEIARIENFLTSTIINIIFSVLNIFIFGIILGIYSLKILAVFIGGTLLFIGWALLFMQRRKKLDFKMYDQNSQNQTSLVQLVLGMQDIKLNNSEKQKRWGWEKIQAKTFNVRTKNLSLSQIQDAGSRLIFHLSNIFITYLAAIAVISGELTLGMLLSIQYIIGQLTSPIEKLISFIYSVQDTKNCMDRINDFYVNEEEESININLHSAFPADKSLKISNLSFRYEDDEEILKNINLTIPEGKVTAIVGSSGSGKTTLLKLLLKMYKPSSGEITVGSTSLYNYSNAFWRANCGIVLPNGFIFSDTIANNIAIGVDHIDKERLLYAANIANIEEYINSMPDGYDTKIRSEGNGLSQGQKQRLLIARAVYKNPNYILFDEATSALDANNEKIIMEKLNKFFHGRTVVVVAHRLSTVRDADQIVVLENGEIIETGNHKSLTDKRGAYFKLVKNQLELSN